MTPPPFSWQPPSGAADAPARLCKRPRWPWDWALVGVECAVVVFLLGVILLPRPVARVELTPEGVARVFTLSDPPSAVTASAPAEDAAPEIAAVSPVASLAARWSSAASPSAATRPATEENRAASSREDALRHRRIAQAWTVKTTRALAINRCTLPQLQTLPGVGPALARRIFTYRQTHGDFQRIDDLLKVDGIGPKKLAKIRPWVFL